MVAENEQKGLTRMMKRKDMETRRRTNVQS
jgi:hypothetical protein